MKRDESSAAANFRIQKKAIVATSILTFAGFFKLYPVLKIRPTNLHGDEQRVLGY